MAKKMTRQVVVMSGISGSGKSSLVRRLAEVSSPFKSKKDLPAVIVSADTFFMQDGVYKFDPSMLGKAHSLCFFQYIEALRAYKGNAIFVDNTNTTVAEIAPYMLAAEAYDWNVEIITFVSKGIGALTACAERNRHGVGLHTIGRQDAALVILVLPHWWKNTEMPIEFETIFRSSL